MFICLRQVFWIQNDCKWSVIDQRNLHFRTEYAGFNDGNFLFAGVDDVFVKLVCMLWWSGFDKGRPIAFFAVRVQGKLGNQKKLSVDIF